MEQLTILSADDYLRYSEAYRQIFDMVFGGVFAYFLVSAGDLRAGIAVANQAFADSGFSPETRPKEALHWATALRAAVLSVASALVYHQEQAYQLASELHEGDKAVRAAIKAIFSDLYDSNRGYRLLYSLRNLMTHHTMEVVALSARALAIQDRVETRFRLRIDRRRASQSKKLNALAAKEFQEMQHDPDIVDLLDDVYSPLTGANRKVCEILYPDLRLNCQTVMDFDSLFERKFGTRALVNNWNPKVPGETPGWTPWAPQVFDFALRYLAS